MRRVSVSKSLTTSVPLWQAEASARRIFFFAQDYFGSDGYADGPEKYYMWQPAVGAVWESPRLDFEKHGQLVTDSSLATRIVTPIQEMYRLQPLLLRSLALSPKG
jgi:hypothetical protein